MKKIGIITLFGYNNYGNRLQMYAVQKIFKNLGFESEVIRYVQKTAKDPLLIRIKVFLAYCLSFKTNIKKDILKNKRERNFKKHAKIHYQETKDYVNPLIIDEKFHERFSFLSVGSDQIWGWFTHSIADFVFLKFAPIQKRISFSPSFGSSELDNKYKDIFANGLSGFNTISVREESGAKLVKELSGKEAEVLCDPTMCLSKQDWIAFSQPHKKKPKKKYILTYFLGQKSENVSLTLEKLRKDYEIVELNSFQFSEFYAVSPSEWVDYIKDADLFLTDSFHGVVFSIILETPFAVYKRVGGESMQTRINNILKKFGLENRCEISLENNDFFRMDFSGFEQVIESEKAKAYDFLKISLHQNK